VLVKNYNLIYTKKTFKIMGDKIKKFNEHYVEKTFNEKQVVSMLVDAVMTSMGDEWIPQEDENFKSFLRGYGLLSIFLDEYGYDDY